MLLEQKTKNAERAYSPLRVLVLLAKRQASPRPRGYGVCVVSVLVEVVPPLS
jgi:hypothetical protein